MARTEIGDVMREILADYHEYVDHSPFDPVYVRPAPQSDCTFIVTPFQIPGSHYFRGRQYIVRKHYSTKLWIFEEIPF